MIVIDIGMPIYCFDCPCCDRENGRCNITRDSVYDKRPFDCPLKEYKRIDFMKKFVDADELIKKLNEEQIEFDEYYKGLGKAKRIIENFLMKNIQNTPTADAQEMKHAYWIEDKEELNECRKLV